MFPGPARSIRASGGAAISPQGRILADPEGLPSDLVAHFGEIGRRGKTQCSRCTVVQVDFEASAANKDVSVLHGCGHRHGNWGPALSAVAHTGGRSKTARVPLSSKRLASAYESAMAKTSATFVPVDRSVIDTVNLRSPLSARDWTGALTDNRLSFRCIHPESVIAAPFAKLASWFSASDALLPSGGFQRGACCNSSAVTLRNPSHAFTSSQARQSSSLDSIIRAFSTARSIIFRFGVQTASSSADTKSMRRNLFLLLALAALPIAYGKSRPGLLDGPTIYVAPANGFEVNIAAAFQKKKTHAQIVMNENDAQFVLRPSMVEIHKESGAGKIAKCLFAYCIGIEDTGDVSVQLVSRESQRVVWAYQVAKSMGVRNRQSLAEAIAKHMRKEFLDSAR